ncbi:TPA: hypothetical protein DEP96_03665 [Candidatus Uhrbacteria bacterium]|nr:hypothetical protein [Candidatus Uhrbacteria bacterium]
MDIVSTTTEAAPGSFSLQIVDGALLVPLPLERFCASNGAYRAEQLLTLLQHKDFEQIWSRRYSWTAEQYQAALVEARALLESIVGQPQELSSVNRWSTVMK